MNAPTLFDQPDAPMLGPTRHGQPATAAQAARDNLPRSGSQRAKVLAALHRCGLTDYEIAQAARISRPHVAGTRRKELQEMGFVEATAERRPTDTGSMAVVWRLTPAGVEAFDAMARRPVNA